MAKKPRVASFTLYGVTKLETKASEDGTLDLLVEATADIEVDLLHAGLTFHGMNSHQTTLVRGILKPGPWRDRFEAFMLEYAASIGEKVNAKAS